MNAWPYERKEKFNHQEAQSRAVEAQRNRVCPMDISSCEIQWKGEWVVSGRFLRHGEGEPEPPSQMHYTLVNRVATRPHEYARSWAAPSYNHSPFAIVESLFPIFRQSPLIKGVVSRGRASPSLLADADRQREAAWNGISVNIQATVATCFVWLARYLCYTEPSARVSWHTG